MREIAGNLSLQHVKTKTFKFCRQTHPNKQRTTDLHHQAMLDRSPYGKNILVEIKGKTCRKCGKLREICPFNIQNLSFQHVGPEILKIFLAVTSGVRRIMSDVSSHRHDGSFAYVFMLCWHGNPGPIHSAGHLDSLFFRWESPTQCERGCHPHV